MNNDVLTDHTPPHSIEAEKAVLGSIFLNPDALPDAMEYLHADDFYKHSHQLIFQTMVDLSDQDQGIDAVTVTDKLKGQNQLDDVGGVAYIVELAESVPTAANLVYYAKIVRKKATLRNLIQTATKIASDGYDEDEDVDTLLDNAERDIMDVSDDRNQSGFKPIRDVLSESFAKIDELSKNGGNDITGLPTGYKALDEMTTGLHPGELMILAARPAVGKTAFALNIAQNVGIKTPKTVALFSLEMSAESLVNRMLCAEGSIDANHLRTGELSSEEWNSLTVAMGTLSNAKIYIDDTPGDRMASIRANCRRLKKEADRDVANGGGLGLIVIDYLQLIEGSNRESRQQEVSEISRQLKKLANELQVPIIALSQLSRGVEQRQDKRPVLSDIRESGSIEQDADIVAFLYRDDYYERDDGDDNEPENQKEDQVDDNVGEVEIIIEKNRSGPRGTVKLLFVKSFNKFSSISYAYDD
ncbi:replicative DNA helicase [Fructilactobacillus lindneri]|uniref:Replicative DNA helicase n=2 Tax=Fructilactobacillus lindneri TaxID=53444 RepID=A0A0R2JUJ7_9LACO|nr:replicative DNA helicase [Fructilactobacillus lindneri]ANZ57538.1 replicative DNA helicase [Fructilactobacillus lindneri]ANZ58806.1 replicative DNA helicase [Fructilactobacillus lindneri]KRN78279.1 replicative DNA helicase [Fructilactobacillus lindneri DSM 20690 = JCM 11027]POG97701.1 replicative DNA helicase [Fructilactobacillus lindneri]POH00088.1 replicative DNA helicase [Fructilactobacillus lindneri]